MIAKTFNSSVALIGIVSIFIASCAVKLAPDYDEKIYNDLITLNENAQTLYAAGENGLKAERYAELEPNYNKIIGRINSLIIQLDARPVPTSKTLEKINIRLEKQGRSPINFEDELPTKKALETILMSFKNLKSNHAKRDVSGFEISTEVLSFNLSMDQAITFESHLKREN